MTDFLIRFAGLGASSIIAQLRQTDTTHRELLDPLCTIFKMIVLKYKDAGTRISVKSDTIFIQDDWVLLGCQRWMNNDNRDDVNQLLLPILYFKGITCGYVNIENFTISRSVLDLLRKEAIEGLEMLKETYQKSKKNGSMVIHCIMEYIEILSTDYSKDHYFTKLSKIDKNDSMFILYKEFNKIWSLNDIDLLVAVISRINSNTEQHIRSMMSIALDKLVDAMDKKIDTFRP